MRTPSRIPILIVLFSTCLRPVYGGGAKAYPNPKADFAHHKTYQWLPPRVLTKTGIDENHPAAPVLKEIVASQLSQRHLAELPSGADLQIQTYLLTESVPQLEAMIFSSITISRVTLCLSKLRS